MVESFFALLTDKVSKRTAGDGELGWDLMADGHCGPNLIFSRRDVVDHFSAIDC